MTRRKYDYDAVAVAAREAYSQGKPMGRTVAEQFGMNVKAAEAFIKQLRRNGFDIPRRGESQWPAPVAPIPEPEGLPSLAEPRGDWSDRAACRGHDTELWFPGRGESTAAAKAICEACPVKDACLDFALINGLHHGIWGGTSERERRRMRRATRLAVAS